MMFPVLLHPDLYRRLRQSARGTRARVRKTLLALREGRWGGGTRVKRLRGIGRPVFEARTDSGDRLLFTAVRTALADQPDRLVCHLQVWDLVEHDDVVRTARRNQAPEAEFLELEALEEFEIDQPPPHPEAAFDELPGDAEGADPLLQLLLPPDSFAPPDTEGIEGGVRWYRVDPFLLADEEEFQRLLDEGGEEHELKLTREQYEVLAAPGPVLLAGSAGSGKTSIAVHRLVRAALDPAAPRCLYLSYSAALVEHARRLFHDLIAAHGPHGKIKAPDFFTFGDLYLSLIPREMREHQARPMTEPMFREWFRKAGRSLEPTLVWEELRSILKGACLSTSQAMLDEADYIELGRKRAPLFVAERPEIYRIAQRYQAWLAEEGRSDRIDLCRRAFAEQKRGKARGYDVVVCDEVQDLTELEVAFVLSLSSRQDLAGILLAGDAQQIVNPSGFRWAEVRRIVGKQAHLRTAPPLLRLRRNMRSVRPVVDLANQLLLLRREVFGRTEEDEPEEAVLAGPVPFEVAAEEEEVLAALADFGPRCAVLTLDDAETARLRRRLGTSRVFHVREAKGLEFESVVLWKLLAPDRDLVERYVRSRGEARLEREARFARLLRHLYVALTRARRHLALYEGPTPHPFWGLERFRAVLERGEVESLAHLFQPTGSPEVWEREGDYFRERGHFRQAAECYRRAGVAEKETEALARAAESVEDWGDALELWTRLGAAEHQAPLLERLGRLREALLLYRQAGMDEAARLCELRLLERDRAWKEAAAGWEELGRFTDAARCWAEAGEERRAIAAAARADEREAAESEESAEGWGRAAAAWLELGDYTAAIRCYEAAGDAAGAALARAHLHEKAGEWRRAAACYRRAGRREAADRCRAHAAEEAHRPAVAARFWERLGEADRALELYLGAGCWRDVARLEKLGPPERLRTLARIRERFDSGDWQEAGELARIRMESLRPRLPDIPWFVAAEEERAAWQEFCLLRDIEIRCRAQEAESREAWSRASRLWLQAGEAERAAAARERRIEQVRDPFRRARARMATGEVERAVHALEESADSASARRVVEAWRDEMEGRWQEAAAVWRDLGRPRDEARCLARLAEPNEPSPEPRSAADSQG